MQNTELPLQRWEIGASAAATALVTLSAIVQEDTASLQSVMRQLHISPWWLKAIVAVPLPVWWVLTALLGAGLFLVGVRLARRYGAPLLFLAPVVMLLLAIAVPKVVYLPFQAGVPSKK